MKLRHASSPAQTRRTFRQRLEFFLGALLLLCGMSMVLVGCGGDSRDDGYAGNPTAPANPSEPSQPDNPGVDPVEAPAGLAYAMTSAIYEAGQPIVPSRPSASGGAIERYAVEPALPAGLVLDASTGVISGAPIDVAASAVYVVTATNAGGHATARVQIEVVRTPAPPAALGYRESAVVYTVGWTIAPNAPSSSGGPITNYAISPALPAGLGFDARTGVISGTPSVETAEAAYAVSGSNVAGSATATLRIAVRAAPVAPASLSYAKPAELYVAREAIEPNTPQVTGGTPSSFSVTPALPDGLSLNTETGAITGTPTAVQAQATYTLTAMNEAGSAQAQVRISVTSRGSWVAAPSLLTARHYAVSAVLPDGKVLVAGGLGIAAAEIYDPVTNTWTATAPMSTARVEATATPLADGRVLVVGGQGVASAEVYDPASGTWQPAGSMSEARSRHTATLLPNGKVLVAGGNGPGTGSRTVELYDPAANTWKLMATQLVTARSQHGAALLPDGKTVLLIGGLNLPAGNLTTAEFFSVDDTGSTQTPPGTVAAATVYTAVALRDGSILAVGDSGTRAAFRFDPATSNWTTSTTNSSRYVPTMTLLADGRVLLAGGGSMPYTAEIYNPDADAWTLATSMAAARSGATASLLGDGSVLVIGGFASGAGVLAGVERYMP